VFLLEEDPALVSVVLQLFELEDIDATPCFSVLELRRGLARDPDRVVVADLWTISGARDLSRAVRAELGWLSRVAAGVILTTGSARAVHIDPSFSAPVTVMPKPYDLDVLADTIRTAWTRPHAVRPAWQRTPSQIGIAPARRGRIGSHRPHG
jgi:hypothetical protein